jgi:hypothetical protein
MPRNAVATGAIDYVLPPAEIGRELGRLGHHRFMIAPEPRAWPTSETLPDGDGDFKRILAILQVATKVDFSQYKHTTIQRRLGRRLMVLRIETLREYARLPPAETGRGRRVVQRSVDQRHQLLSRPGHLRSARASYQAAAEEREQRKNANHCGCGTRLCDGRRSLFACDPAARVSSRSRSFRLLFNCSGPTLANRRWTALVTVCTGA